jgi:initiation factor 2B subunit 1/2 family protein
VEKLLRRAEAIAGDRDRGAAELLAITLPLLADAIAAGDGPLLAVVRMICRGQPAMAPLWNACAAAVSDTAQPGRFARVRAEMERAPAALVRAARAALDDGLGPDPSPHLLTVSYSSSVAGVLGDLARTRHLQVTCGEGRPRYEGRRMASDLAGRGLAVTLATDAALTSKLTSASAVVVGADSFGPSVWMNKVGTRGLVAAASLAGVPTFVICTRDKAAAGGVRLPGDGSPDEVWADAPAGVQVENPYFEAIPVELATLFLMETGRVAPAQLDRISGRFSSDIARLMRAFGQ